MAMEMQPFLHEVRYDQTWLEQVLLQLGDMFEIRIVWNSDTAVLTGALALAGGLVGGYAGGRMGAALGAGIGSAAGLGVSTYVSLREIWASVKHQLKGIFNVILNYLRQMDPVDYNHAFKLVMACTASLRKLGLMIKNFISSELGKDVICNILTTGLA
ncbi:protein C19orf12-like isoform X1 [Cydia strobilella]|uniref:protein C19orf12-like isoform X1 n=1 Tax=Cydia strobilella TaxID=1100964 RepID=UPI00300642B1